jgi:hypothetical protein
MQRRGTYLSFFVSTFGMKLSSYFLLSTFLKPCVSCLLKLESSTEVWRWSELEIR